MNKFIKKDIPSAIIKSVKDALNDNQAKPLLLKENDQFNGKSMRTKSSVFNITY